jgi:RNA polymerase sigma-70 factor (ECF subfamily)
MANAGPTDELVVRAQGGDQGSYERIFARVADRGLLYVRLRLGHKLRERLDPFDVLQDAYLEAHKSFHAFEARGDGAFLRWIYRIIDNRVRNLADYHGAQKRHSEMGEVHLPQVLEQLRAGQPGPSTAYARTEQQESLLRAMEELSPVEKEALLLRYFQERTLDEIAGELGRSVSAVRRLLAKAELELGAALRSE